MIEKAIAAALEPLVEDIVALERKLDTTIQRTAERLDTMPLTPGPQGERGTKGDAGEAGTKGAQGERGDAGTKGEAGRDADPLAVAHALKLDAEFLAKTTGPRGADGKHGNDGAGIDTPQWTTGEVYRQGTCVVAHVGQHFVALKDTARSVDDPEHWRRIGTGGFRHRGAFRADATYVEGDLFVNNFSTFCVVNGAPTLMAGRGPVGKTGEPGTQGERGKDGSDGATIIASQVEGFQMVLVQRLGDGSLNHIEADFTSAFRELVEAAVPDLMLTLDELRSEVAALKRDVRRMTA